MAYSITSMGAPPTPRTEADRPGRSSNLRFRWCLVVFCCFALVAAATEPASLTASGQPDGRPGSFSDIVIALKNGMPSAEHPEVGMLLSESCPSGRCGVYAICSGILASRSRFVTAGHCVDNRTRDYWVFLRHGGIVAVRPGSVSHFCDHRSDCDSSIADIAILELATPVEDVTPARVGILAGGGAAVIAGFGDSNPYRADNGILRIARVDPKHCAPGTLCHLVSETTPAACNHDSGGPMFADGAVVGIARRSENGCRSGWGLYVDLTSADMVAWWRKEIGPMAHAPSSMASQLEIDCTRPGCWSVTAGGRHRYRIEVADGARLLRVTANFSLTSPADHCSGKNTSACLVDYDLSLEMAEAGSGDCVCQNDFKQIAVCECARPANGPWIVNIQSSSGRGSYQLTGRVLY